MQLDGSQVTARNTSGGVGCMSYDPSIHLSEVERRATNEFEQGRPCIRRHLCDPIEEYGRRTGHADLICEAIDGRVGEDAPSDWGSTP